MIPIWPGDYTRWQEAYFVLLAVVIVVEILAFALPLWTFHKSVLEQKSVLRKQIDQLYKGHHDKLKLLMDLGDESAKQQTRDYLIKLSKQYELIEKMPTWPVGLRLRWRFTVNNLFLVIPLLGDLAQKKLGWPSLPDSVISLVKALFS